MSNATKKQIAIQERFGTYCVMGQDNNGEWVGVEPGNDEFPTREEAQECVDSWTDLNGEMEQVDDLPSV